MFADRPVSAPASVESFAFAVQGVGRTHLRAFASTISLVPSVESLRDALQEVRPKPVVISPHHRDFECVAKAVLAELLRDLPDRRDRGEYERVLTLSCGDGDLQVGRRPCGR